MVDHAKRNAQMSASGAPPRLDELVLAATAARRYFLEDQTKVEIAAAMGLSRFKVARLLGLARESGLVRITIAAPGEVDPELSGRLREHLGLTRALVLTTADPGADALPVRRALADVAARLLTEILTPADVLGLAWSRSVLETAARLDRPPPCEVVQLTGALAGPEVNLVEAVDGVARRGGGRGWSFWAPLFVSDPGSVDVVTRQPDTAAAFARFPHVTRALVGIGCWQPVASNLRAALTPDERAALHAAGAVADLAGTFLDAAGRPLTMPLSRQVVGIDAATLRSVPEVICLAHGRASAPAVRVAVRAGYVGSLVTTAALAQDLLTTKG